MLAARFYNAGPRLPQLLTAVTMGSLHQSHMRAEGTKSWHVLQHRCSKVTCNLCVCKHGSETCHLGSLSPTHDLAGVLRCARARRDARGRALHRVLAEAGRAARAVATAGPVLAHRCAVNPFLLFFPVRVGTFGGHSPCHKLCGLSCSRSHVLLQVFHIQCWIRVVTCTL